MSQQRKMERRKQKKLHLLGEDKSTEQYLEYIEQYGLHINWKEPET